MSQLFGSVPQVCSRYQSPGQWHRQHNDEKSARYVQRRDGQDEVLACVVRCTRGAAGLLREVWDVQQRVGDPYVKYAGTDKTYVKMEITLALQGVSSLNRREGEK